MHHKYFFILSLYSYLKKLIYIIVYVWIKLYLDINKFFNFYSENTIVTCGEDGNVFSWDPRAGSEPQLKLKPHNEEKLARPKCGKFVSSIDIENDSLVNIYLIIYWINLFIYLFLIKSNIYFTISCCYTKVSKYIILFNQMKLIIFRFVVVALELGYLIFVQWNWKILYLLQSIQ